MSRAKTSPPSRSSGSTTNARGDATRELLIVTAERLLAERGIGSVPLRDIGLAAGQRNNGVVQYHFGDRESLVRAIAAYRSRSLEEMSADLVADIVSGGRAPKVEDIVRTFVTALAMNLEDDSYFLRFSSRCIVERGNLTSLDDTFPSGLTTTLRSIMRRLLPDHSDALLYERWQVLMTSAIHTLARYQVAMHVGRLPAPIDDLIDDLVRFLTSGLEAPLR